LKNALLQVRAIVFDVQVSAPVPHAAQAPLVTKKPVLHFVGTRSLLQVNALVGQINA
jgi:hypothetical protein